MNAVGWVSLGFLACFIINRMFEAVSKSHAKEFAYDCMKCKYPCGVAKYCTEMRQALNECDECGGVEDAISNEVSEISD